MRKAMVSSVAALALCAAMAGCGSSSSSSSSSTGPILICNIDGFTGSVGGKNLWHATQTAVDIINKAGGVGSLHRKLKLKVFDTESKTDLAGSLASSAVSQGCKALLGTSSSDESLRIEPIAEHAKVPLFIPGNGSPQLTTLGYHWTFKLVGGVESQVPSSMKAIQADCKLIAPAPCTMAVTYTNDAWGQPGAQVAKKTAASLGIDLVGEFPYDSTQPDLTSLALQIKQKKPSIVFDWGYPTTAITVSKALKSVGVDPKVVFATGYGTDTYATMGSAINYGIGMTSWSPDIKIPTSQGQAQLDQFISTYDQKYPRADLYIDGGNSGTYYTSVQIIAKAMDACKCTGGDALNKALLATDMSQNSPAPYALLLPQSKLTFLPWAPKGQISQQNAETAFLNTQFQGGNQVPVFPPGYGHQLDGTPWGTS